MVKMVPVLTLIVGSLFLACLPWRAGPCPLGWPVIWFGCGTVISWFVYLALICLLVYSILKSAGTKKSPETPLDILKRRYAKGEVTKEEFDRMRDELHD